VPEGLRVCFFRARFTLDTSDLPINALRRHYKPGVILASGLTVGRQARLDCARVAGGDAEDAEQTGEVGLQSGGIGRDRHLRIEGKALDQREPERRMVRRSRQSFVLYRLPRHQKQVTLPRVCLDEADLPAPRDVPKQSRQKTPVAGDLADGRAVTCCCSHVGLWKASHACFLRNFKPAMLTPSIPSRSAPGAGTGFGSKPQTSEM